MQYTYLISVIRLPTALADNSQICTLFSAFRFVTSAYSTHWAGRAHGSTYVEWIVTITAKVGRPLWCSIKLVSDGDDADGCLYGVLPACYGGADAMMAGTFRCLAVLRGVEIDAVLSPESLYPSRAARGTKIFLPWGNDGHG